MTEKKCVALNHASHPHYSDHLCPISAIMGMPIIVLEEEDYIQCTKFYPDVEVQLVDYLEFNLEYLIQRYDVLFMSDLWDRDIFKEKFHLLEKKYGKTMRNVHVPHGYSDKGFYLRKAAKEDITLVYGKAMLEMFQEEGVMDDLKDYVITGNYRYSYYQKHKAYYDKLVNQELMFKVDKNRPTLLYAPTWMDLEESSSYFEGIDFILKDLQNKFNILIKPHPRLELDNAVFYHEILGRYSGHPHIHFITDFHAMYPLLESSDLYLGDVSSVGYDYLIYNRPMFFLNKDNRNPKFDKRSFLFNCGIDIKRSQFSEIAEIIESNLEGDKEKFGAIRKKVYDHTFEKKLSFEKIKQEIISCVSKDSTGY